MVMRSRSKEGNALGLVAGIGLIMSTFAFTVLPSGSTASAAGVPAGMTQGFSEIVKKVTPAVVNIAVTGGGKAGAEAGDRRCRLVPLVDRRVKKRREVNFRLLRRCRLVEGMDAPIRAQDPASLSIRTDLS
jgi:S1-C subfamily serine protease